MLIPDRAALLADLAARPDGSIHRIELRFAGADPRAKLRREARISAGELAALRARLERLDARSAHGPWTRATLGLIATHPGVRAADLALRLRRDTRSFKTDVRKLKEHGLTESLEVGYRLSPRGRALLRRLGR